MRTRLLAPLCVFALATGCVTQPIAPNDSPENRSLNRRIEIVLAPGGAVTTGSR